MSVAIKFKVSISHVVDNSALPSTDLKERIAISSYYKAKEKWFAQDGYLDDWLAALAEINASTTVH